MTRAATRHDRVRVLGAEHLLLPRVAHGALVDGEEARAHLHALGTQREGRADAATVGDAAGGDDGNGNGLAHAGHERHGGELADVTTRLGALGDHGIDAKALHAPGLRRGGDDGNDLDAGIAPHGQVLDRAAGARGDDLDAELDDELGDLGRERVHEHDVTAKGLAGLRLSLLDLLGNPIELGATAGDDAQAAGLADRRGKRGIRDAGHAALDDGSLDAQEFGYSRFHEALRPTSGSRYARQCRQWSRDR